MKRTSSAVWLEKYQRWQINVQKDNTRRTFSSSTKGRNGQRECHRKADAWLDDNVENGSVRVGALLDEYLENVGKRASKSALIKETYHVNSFIRPHIGNRKIHSLTAQDLQDIIDNSYQRKQASGEVKTMAKKSLQNIRATIMSFLKFCRKKSVTTLFPEDLTIPTGARSKDRSILQPDGIVKLFQVDSTLLYNKAVFDDYIYAYRFQVLTGLRPGELMGLKREDIVGAVVNVRRSINVYNEVTKGKNENAVRSFTMSELAQQTIEKQFALLNDEYVFGINSQSTYRHRWQKFCESNDMPVISPYELRHTFVSIAKQLPAGQIKQLIGHSKNMDTFGTYGHQLNGESAETANDVNKLFADIIKSVF